MWVSLGLMILTFYSSNLKRRPQAFWGCLFSLCSRAVNPALVAESPEFEKTTVSPAAGGVNPYLLGLWKEAVRKMVSWLVDGHPVSLDGGGEAWAPQIPSKLLTGGRWAPSSGVGSEQDWPSSALP